MKKLYPEESVQAIADAIRAKKDLQIDKAGKMKIADMAKKISGIRLGCPINVSMHMQDGVWVRPDGWPDLDALEYGEDELYMTFDASSRIDDPFCSFTISGANYTVTIGSQTWTKDAGSTFQYAFAGSDGTYPLVHVKADGHITSFAFVGYTTNGRTYSRKQNPLVERIGDVYDYGGGSGWGTYYLEREKVVRHACASRSLAELWSCNYSLQSLDLSGWDTTNWAVTSLYCTWSGCHSLQSLDVSGWDTTNWAVTSLYCTWSGCYSLQSLDVSGWDTTNWAVTSLQYTWSGCYSLQSLDLSGWDTTKWAVTSLQSTWSCCYSLQSLDVSGWDTTKWAVTSLQSTWYCNYSLQSLDVSGWDTTNWAVTSLQYTWYCNYSLQSLDVSGWDTTNWAVTSLYCTWNGCYSLQSLDVSGWDTTNWNVSSILCMVYELRSLRKLDLSFLDMSKITEWTSSSYPQCTYEGLEEFVCGENNYGKFVQTYAYVRIMNSIKLTHDSIVEFGKMLAPVTTKHYFQMGSELSNKLTTAEKAEITAKGWTII